MFEVKTQTLRALDGADTDQYKNLMEPRKIFQQKCH